VTTHQAAIAARRSRRAGVAQAPTQALFTWLADRETRRQKP